MTYEKSVTETDGKKDVKVEIEKQLDEIENELDIYKGDYFVEHYSNVGFRVYSKTNIITYGILKAITVMGFYCVSISIDSETGLVYGLFNFKDSE